MKSSALSSGQPVTLPGAAVLTPFAGREAMILEELPDAAFVVDKAWRIVFSNREGKALLDKPADATRSGDQPLFFTQAFPRLAGTAAEQELRYAARERKAVEVEHWNANAQCLCTFRGKALPSGEFVITVRRCVTRTQTTNDAVRRESLQILRHTIPALLSYVDREYRYQFCTQAYTEWFGLKQSELIGRPVRDVVGQQAWEAIEGYFAQTMAGENVDYEAELPYDKCGPRWVHGMYRPHRDQNGEVVGVVVLVSDITERKRAELHSQFLNRLYPLLAEARGPETPARVALQEVAKYLQVDGANFGERVDDGQAFQIQEEFRTSGPSVRGTYVTGHFTPREAHLLLEGGTGLAVTDVRTDPRVSETRMNFEELDIRAFMAQPMIVSGRMKGVLTATSHTPREWRGDEMQLLKDVAAHLFPAIERERTAAALRRSEQRFRRLVEVTSQMVWVTGADGKPVEDSPSWRAFTGRSLDEWLGNRWLEVIHPEDRERVTKVWNEATRTGKNYQIGFRQIHHSGEYRHVFCQAVPVYDDHGQIREWVGMNVDVTDRRRAEIKLEESEQRFRLATQTGKIGVWDWNIRKNRVEWTDSLYQIHGLKKGDYDGTVEGFGKLVHPGDVERVTEALQRSLRGEDPYELTFRTLRPNGEVAWIYTNAMMVREQGLAVRMLGVTMDITELKKTEGALRDSEERFRLIFDTVNAGLVMVSPDGVYQDVNPAMCRYIGRRREEIVGRSVHEFIPAGQGDLMQKIRAEINERQGWQGEFPLRRPDGSILQLEWHIAVLPDGTRLGATTDVTARKQAEETLRRARAQLEAHAAVLEQTVAERTAKLQETVTELEAFSYSISHDMRAPLRAMNGFAQLLLEDYAPRLEKEAVHYLERICKSATRMDMLVQDVLAYSKISKGELHLHPVDFIRLTREVIQQGPEFQAPRARITLQEPGPVVLGHEAYLVQCVSNLLGNAVKFVASGAVPEIKVWHEAAAGLVRIYFEDNGIGIAPQHQHRIFQIFGRIHPQTKYPGTGIGLAIVRRAIERMGGRIGLESEAGRGSRFWLELKEAQGKREELSSGRPEFQK